MNKAVLMGRLTKNPEIRYSQGESSTAFAKFTLAVDRRFRKEGSNEQNADFISCVAFGKTAEFMEKHTHQGTKLVVEGRIQTGSYTNKDGNKVYTTDVVVENIEFAESKNSSSSNNYNGGGYASQQQQLSNTAEDGFMNIPDGLEDEGLPFN